MRLQQSETTQVTSGALSADLDMNQHAIQLTYGLDTDDTMSGLFVKMVVDTNAQGIGAPLFVAADGHLDTADADASTTAPCVALAAEAGTGTKKVLLHGIMRNDDWSWTTGPGTTGLIYLSTSVGTLTQTRPTGTGDIVQPVGWALNATHMYFCPSFIYLTHI